MDVGQDAAGRDSDAAEKLNAASRQGRRVSVVLRRQWRMAGRVGGAENGRKSTKITHLVELLVVADGQLDVAGDDAGLPARNEPVWRSWLDRDGWVGRAVAVWAGGVS